MSTVKIVVDYDEVTGDIKLQSGFFLCSFAGLSITDADKAKDSNDSIGNLVKLKNAGFTVDDIVELNRKELI
jgi:hypothetical protein